MFAEIVLMSQDFERFLNDSRIHEAARRRRHARDELELLAGETTMLDVIAACAEAQEEVSITLVDGRLRTGLIVSYGTDMVMQSTSDAHQIRLIPYQAISVIDCGTATGTATGTDLPGSAVTLHDVLTEWAQNRMPVVAHAVGTAVAGTLSAAGADVICVLTPQRTHRYLAVYSLTEVSASSVS